MKRTFLILTVITMLFMTACRQTVSTYQEQYDLGVRFLNEENYEEAIIAFEAAIRIDPKNPEAYISLADVYIKQGDTNKAKEILEKGLENNPGNEEIIAKLDELTSETEVMTTTDSITETPIEDSTLSEVKRMENLLRTGMTSNMLRYEEILPFGHTIDSFRNLSIESIKNLVEQNGYNYDVNQYDEGISINILCNFGSKAQIEFYRGTIESIFFYRESVYIRDIAIGDTTEDVLSKLGFSNGAEITECINKLAEPEFETEEELRAYVDTLLENFCVYAGTDYISLNCGWEEGEKFRITNMNIIITYNESNGKYTHVSLDFNTAKNDTMNFNSLKHCYLEFH